jgi:hypothetical protein
MDNFNKPFLSGDLAEFIGSTFGIRTGTVLDRAKPLRAATPPLLSKNGHGPRAGARMTNADAVNSILANALDHPRGDDLANSVRRVRQLKPDEPLVELPAGFTQGLTFFQARNAGSALESLLADIRSDRLSTWAAGESYVLAVTLDSRGASVFFSLNKPKRSSLDFRNAVHGFAKPGFSQRVRVVERNITVGGDVFLQLAEKLGPPQ